MITLGKEAMKHGEIMSKAVVLEVSDNIQICIRHRRAPNGDAE